MASWKARKKGKVMRCSNKKSLTRLSMLGLMTILILMRQPKKFTSPNQPSKLKPRVKTRQMGRTSLKRRRR